MQDSLTILYLLKAKIKVFIALLVLLFGILFPIRNLIGQNVIPGVNQIDEYRNLLVGKKIGFVGNHTSITQTGQHSVDFLIANNINIVRLFCPEHGFRGEVDAGKDIKTDVDKATNLKIVSLYGNNKKPTKANLAGIDIMIFDLQDVGVRFYTYLSTLHYVMEACAENNIQVIVFDRPNPNGALIDGPILKPEHKSFVGIHPIPIAHGLTLGEAANMINGERWLANSVKANLIVIKCKGYTHKTTYNLPVNPSPNLKTMAAINWYPSTCLFEGTELSVGRGTNNPFLYIGGNHKNYGEFTFTPKPMLGATQPKLNNIVCFGIDLTNIKPPAKIDISLVINFYNKSENKLNFFDNFFDKLTGDKQVRLDIINGLSEMDIRAKWATELANYKKIRSKYILYAD